MQMWLKIFGSLCAFVIIGAGAALFADAVLQAHEERQFEDRLVHLRDLEEFKTAADYIVQIAQEEGGAYAFDLLINVDFVKGLDTHLLGHFAGNVLYEQEKLNGMRLCTDDLWYSCAHSIVINALLEEGQGVFDIIGDVCTHVPGSAGYDLCFHGFGHGVIAYAEYELPKALELCSRLGTEHQRNEAHECAGGVIMDLRDGLHDKDLWREFGQKYIPQGNPTELCESDHVRDEFRHVCMVYITPFIFDAIGVGRQIPTDDEIQEALTYCEEVEDAELRQSCYGGFPKELISYIHDRDVRMYAQSTDDDLRRMYSLCTLASSVLGIETCVKKSVGALDRRGTHPYTLALRYCDLLSDAAHKDICYRQLIKERTYASIPQIENQGFCAQLPSSYKNDCELKVK